MADETPPPTGIATPTMATGTSTPAGLELDATQREASLRVSLADLTARAGAQYAHRDYEGAAEAYARAAEMQAEMNGETSPENAEILFLYGRALFRVGQAKSDVLGGRAPAAPAGGGEAEGEKKKGKGVKKSQKQRQKKGGDDAGPAADAAAPATEATAEADRVAEEAVGIIASEADGAKKTDESTENKALFQFTGDENFDDSDEEGAEEDAEGDEEEDDDLAVAFEILDLARVLFTKRLEANQSEKEDGKGKEVETSDGDSPIVKHIKERLADTHDLLAEISLENERYPNAITDSRASLKYKQELYSEDSEVIAEAHFKLSLALEFASVTTSSEEDTDKSGPKPVDQDLRDEAAKELEAAIASTKLKLQNKEVELATLHSPEDNDATRKQIAEVKDIIADMEQRLVDLQKPPIDVNAALYGAAGNAMGGILGAALGESAAQTESRIEEAKKTATDLTGLVRKKAKDEQPKPKTDEAEKANGHGTNGSGVGKRKAEEPVEGTPEAESKKAKVEEAVEA
ncbi:putative histone h1-binding protein [Phialemonium atrogriseum]|uniref:Histone h1-binding protein n=1 Tax=Phialemonium atrogriseum TaxID=1093897 RepID=A0AAJ0FK95_9PEZI|nr:putative histone h1-binding protein [Phialemonium atrogriseum]KAK1770832.1 putative histone h1-binding protein [Phialemonium atrogriseum]